MADDGGEGNSRRGAVAALLIIVVLAGAALFLVRGLSHDNQIQDCVASGRTNCAPVGVTR